MIALMKHILLTLTLAGALVSSLYAQTIYTSISDAVQNKEEARILHIPSGSKVSVADWRDITQLEGLTELRIFSDNMIFIPDIISRLQALEVLEIQTNQDVKWPEEAMESLQSIKDLTLENCLGNEVPAFVTKLENLETLTLSDRDAKRFQAPFSPLAKLYALEVRMPNLDEWPQGIQAFSNLKSLTIESKKISEIPEQENGWLKLENVTLHLESLTFLPASLIPPSLQTLKIDCPALSMWPSSLSNLPELTELFLRGGLQTGPMPSLAGSVSLRSAVFFDVEMPGKESGLDRCTGMEEIRFYRCGLAQFDWKSLRGISLAILGVHHCTGVNYNKINKKLSVSQLIIQDDRLDKMPPGIHKIETLTTLDVSGERLASLGKIWKCQSLSSLTVARTEALKSLPELKPGLGRNLEELHIWAYSLQTVPESIGQLVQLRRLTLRADQFRSLPGSLWGLSNLEDLVLGGVSPEVMPDSSTKGLNSLRNVVLYVHKNMSEARRETLRQYFSQGRVTIKNQIRN